MIDFAVRFRGPSQGFFGAPHAEKAVSRLLEAASVLHHSRRRTLCLLFDDYTIRSVYDSDESLEMKKSLLALDLILKYYLAELGSSRELIVESSPIKNPEISIWINRKMRKAVYSLSGDVRGNRPRLTFDLDRPIEEQVLQRIRAGLERDSVLTVYSAAEFEDALSLFEKTVRLSQAQRRQIPEKDFFRLSLSLKAPKRAEATVESATLVLTRSEVSDLISNRLSRLKKILSDFVDIREIEVVDGEWKASFFFEEGLFSLSSVEDVERIAKAFASFDEQGLVCLSPKEKRAKRVWPSFDFSVSRSGEVRISFREGSLLLDVELFSEFGVKAAGFLAANPRRAKRLLLLYRLAKHGVLDSLKEDFEKTLERTISSAPSLRGEFRKERVKVL